MRILHVLNHSLPEVDGYSIRSHNILVHQERHGLEVLAVTSPKHGKFDDSIENIGGISFYRTNHFEAMHGFKSLPFIKEGLLMLRFGERILEIARREKVDLIHAHSPSLNGIPAHAVARRLGLPAVYELRGLWAEGREDRRLTNFELIKFISSRWIETQLIKRVDAITVISQGLKQEILARGIPEGKIHIIPNGVDTARFCPRPVHNDLKRKLGLQGRFLLGFIGSFRYYEGLDLLLRALAEVVKLRSEIHLICVGIDEQDQLKKLTNSLQLDNFVTFTGKVAPDEVLDYYSIVDLFIYPRRKMRLTELVTPLKPLEAMALEKLVLASDVAGHKELVEDSVTGFLFEAGNEANLAKMIIDIASNFSSLNRIGRNARISVSANRNWNDIISGYTDLYRSLKLSR